MTSRQPTRSAMHSARRRAQTLVDRVRDRPPDQPGASRVLTIARGADELRGLAGQEQVLSRIVATPYTGNPSPWTIEHVEVTDGQVRFRAHSDSATTASGAISFAPAPGDLGTEATVALDLEGPDLAAGAMAHKMLRRLKALAETGEIPTLAHNTSARHAPVDQQEEV